MSELTKLVKMYATQKSAFDESHRKLLECENTNDWTQARSSLDALNIVASLLTNEIAPNSEKFYSKLGSSDPITGLKRFGINTEAKIVDLRTNVQSFQNNCQNILAEFSEKVNLHSPVVTVPTVNIAATVLNSVFATDVISEKDIEMELQRVTQEKEDAEIARKAQAVRERKAQEASEQAHFDNEVGATANHHNGRLV